MNFLMLDALFILYLFIKVHVLLNNVKTILFQIVFLLMWQGF